MARNGNPKNLTNAGRGRPKGSKNKISACAKDAFQQAFDELGGIKGLVEWAQLFPSDFYKLYARLIPVENRMAGPDGEAIKVKVEFV